MDEISSVVPIYGEITFERIERKDLQWPCPKKEHPGTKSLHGERFYRKNVLGSFFALTYKASAELPDSDSP